MNKRKTGIILLIVMFIFYCNLEVFSSYAANVSVSVGVSASTVNVGGSVTATITVSGSDLSAYEIYVSYNSSVLEYSSGSGSAVVGGGSGSLTLVGTGPGSTSITFKAIAGGSSSISAGGGEAYNINLESLSISGGSASVTVSAPTQAPTQAPTESNTSSSGNGNSGGSGNNSGNGNSGGSGNNSGNGNNNGNGNNGGNGSNNTTESTTQSTTESTTGESTTTESDASDNCFLSSLEISLGELSPAFDKNTLSYTASISDEEEIDRIEINAVPEDDLAQVTIEGNEGLEPGIDKTATITVTAENGDTKVYSIDITWIDTNVYITVDGKKYHFAKDYQGVYPPEGFRKATSTYEDSEIIVYTTPNGFVECVYLLDDSENGEWYVYYKESGTVIPLVYTSPAYIQYIILLPDETVEIPEGYTAFTYQLNGSEITAYHQSENDTIILFYAMNTNSIANWYYYDTVERTLLRYTDPAEEDEDIVATPTDAESPIMKFYHDNEFLIMIIAAALAGVMLITIIVLICVLARTKKKYKQAIANTATAELVNEEPIPVESTSEKQDEITVTDAPIVADEEPVANEADTTGAASSIDEEAPVTEAPVEESPVIEESPVTEKEPPQPEKPQTLQFKPIINTIHMPPPKKVDPISEDTDEPDSEE